MTDYLQTSALKAALRYGDSIDKLPLLAYNVDDNSACGVLKRWSRFLASMYRDIPFLERALNTTGTEFDFGSTEYDGMSGAVLQCWYLYFVLEMGILIHQNGKIPGSQQYISSGLPYMLEDVVQQVARDSAAMSKTASADTSVCKLEFDRYCQLGEAVAEGYRDTISQLPFLRNEVPVLWEWNKLISQIFHDIPFVEDVSRSDAEFKKFDFDTVSYQHISGHSLAAWYHGFIRGIVKLFILYDTVEESEFIFGLFIGPIHLRIRQHRAQIDVYPIRRYLDAERTLQKHPTFAALAEFQQVQRTTPPALVDFLAAINTTRYLTVWWHQWEGHSNLDVVLEVLHQLYVDHVANGTPVFSIEDSPLVFDHKDFHLQISATCT